MSDRKAAARLFRNACREAKLLIMVWAVALVWTVGYCYLHGYRHPPDSLVVQSGLTTSRSADDFRTVLGFPDWVFVGIIVPWGACTTFTVVFSLFILRDDDLGAESEERRGDGH
jgi:hypothetical protein